MIRTVLAILALFVAAVAGGSSLFVVDQGEAGAVYAFGRIDRIVADPGLHLKWPAPFQNVVAVDLRGRMLVSPDGDGYRSSDGRTLVVGWYALWRVSDPSAFIGAFGVGGVEADRGLSGLMRDALRQQIATQSLAALLAGAGDGAAQRAFKSLAPALARRGVALLDLHLTKIGLAADETSAIVARMSSEQRDLAAGVLATDLARARATRVDADRQAQATLAAAQRRAQTIRGQGDSRAAAIDAVGYAEDPEFAAFFHSLQAYRETFGAHPPLFILEPSSDFLRFMANPAAKSPAKPATPAMPARAAR